MKKGNAIALGAMLSLAAATAQAAPVAIDSLTVETVSLTVTINGGSSYSWGGTLDTPILIEMGVYQDPIVEWGTPGTDPYAKIYSTGIYGAPPPNGTVDFAAGTIDVDFSSIYADVELLLYSFTVGPLGNLSGTSTPPDAYALDWGGNWSVRVTPSGGMSGFMQGSFSGLDISGTVTIEIAGTVTPVPLPAAVWLFASGLLGLVGVARRR